METATTREVTRDEFLAAVDALGSGGRQARGAVSFRNAGEVLEALRAGVIDKKEARRALGYRLRRQPVQLRRARRRRAKKTE